MRFFTTRNIAGSRANEAIRISGPCECGCDERRGPVTGILTGSSALLFFSIIAETEKELETIRTIRDVIESQ